MATSEEIKDYYDAPMEPIHPCRHMETRHCVLWPGKYGEMPEPEPRKEVCPQGMCGRHRNRDNGLPEDLHVINLGTGEAVTVRTWWGNGLANGTSLTTSKKTNSKVCRLSSMVSCVKAPPKRNDHKEQ